jgi:hypothetical protein
VMAVCAVGAPVVAVALVAPVPLPVPVPVPAVADPVLPVPAPVPVPVPVPAVADPVALLPLDPGGALIAAPAPVPVPLPLPAAAPIPVDAGGALAPTPGLVQPLPDAGAVPPVLSEYVASGPSVPAVPESGLPPAGSAGTKAASPSSTPSSNVGGGSVEPARALGLVVPRRVASQASPGEECLAAAASGAGQPLGCVGLTVVPGVTVGGVTASRSGSGVGGLPISGADARRLAMVAVLMLGVGMLSVRTRRPTGEVTDLHTTSR